MSHRLPFLVVPAAAMLILGAAPWTHAPGAATTTGQNTSIAAKAQLPPCRRLDAPPSPPEGWHYLPEISAVCVADIFRGATQGTGTGPARQIQVHTKQDVGILERRTDVALSAATTLRWKWNVEQLPSKAAEDVAPHHDYLSIAVMFDNGQDLTYMWSAMLPPEKGFRCPLPGWDTRETHVVVRSDAKELGKWLSEERRVLADYAKHVGGKPPAKITHVWLIANTIFQQGEGVARFGDISIGADRAGQRIRIY
jgi:hypothetical protein